MVIPVLLYHGKTKWKYQTLSDLFETIDEDWKQFLPGFEYIYNDLGKLGDDEIEALNNKFLAASFLALKHSQEKEWIEGNAVDLLILASQGSKWLVKSFIIYLYSRGKLEEKILNSLPDPIKKDVMNTLDIYLEKGRKEGFEKGIEKGIEEGKALIVRNLINAGKLSISEIASLAGVSESFVKKVHASINRKH